MKVSGILGFILILSGFSGPRCDATVYNSDGTAASVQSIHNNQAQNGDTITLPAGTFTWTQKVNITKGVTIQGQTTTDTVNGTANDRTIIVDNPSTNIELFNFHNTSATNVLRVTGITFTGGNHGMFNSAIFDWNGNSNLHRVDHCHFTNINRLPAFIWTGTYGVCDHCVADHLISQSQGFWVWTGLRDSSYGDLEWASPAGYGGPNFFFIEDCYLNNPNGRVNAAGGVDCIYGGKFVVRHCKLFDIEILCHGTESGRRRGGRAQEIYNNEYHWSDVTTMDGIRSGSLIAHDNTYFGSQPHGYGMQTYRMFNDFGPPWGAANGHNAWDVNDGNGHVLIALDQPCRGQGDLITGDNPTPAWPHQAIEPCYSWNNVFVPTGAHINWDLAINPPLQEGRDYFSDTPMPGYTPYVYPHPLASSGGSGGSSARAAVADFNSDGHPDWALRNAGTRQTAIWYLNNNFYIGGAYGPTLVAGWALRGLADFNLDSHSDYALFAPNTNQTALWYLSGPTFIGGAYGPTLPNGWELVATADFNGDNKPDYVLYNAGTYQTAIWYLNNNVYVGGGYGPTLPPGWSLTGVADFNRDGHTDYVLFHPSSGYTAICYLSGTTLIGAAWGPIVPSGWALVATADFNGDGKPDYLLYNASTRQTAIWYLNNNVYIGSAWGPTLPAGWSLVAP